MTFPTSPEAIAQRMDAIDPVAYARSRNFINGAVTGLSPYISRGVISTRQVLMHLLQKGYKLYQAEKLIQELAWRDYFQQVWRAKGDLFQALKQEQPVVTHYAIPGAIARATTGIEAIDTAITGLYETGYMHNHVRMYTASITCNIARSHWLAPAQWMYYHLLDADWASNACSWQWVSGAFSSKLYYANQDNINKYCGTTKRNSFLDLPYDAFHTMPVPEQLRQTMPLQLHSKLPQRDSIRIDVSLDTCIYHFYNLDPQWKQDVPMNRILLLEPSFFNKYPVSENTIAFVLALGRNIANLQVFTGEFSELVQHYRLNTIYYKEHPTCRHYSGIEVPRDWMFPEVNGYYPSFFSYWKQCEKYLKRLSGNSHQQTLF